MTAATAADDLGSISLPSIGTRAAGAAVEPAVFVVTAAVIGIVDYYLEAPIGGFGASSFWIAFWLLAVWSAWHWPAAQTLASSFAGNHVATLDGSPAAPLTLAARELTRAGILYGLPLLALETNVVPVVALIEGAEEAAVVEASTAQLQMDLNTVHTALTAGILSSGAPPTDLRSLADLLTAVLPVLARRPRPAAWGPLR